MFESPKSWAVRQVKWGYPGSGGSILDVKEGLLCQLGTRVPCAGHWWTKSWNGKLKDAGLKASFVLQGVITRSGSMICTHLSDAYLCLIHVSSPHELRLSAFRGRSHNSLDSPCQHAICVTSGLSVVLFNRTSRGCAAHRRCLPWGSYKQHMCCTCH